MGNYNNSRGRRDSGDIEMHKAICDECGEQCRVPFKPTSGKPVYCSDCFEGRESESYEAICDDCGAKCKLPFKPSRDKEVYCSACFEDRGNTRSYDNDRSSNGGGSSMTSEQFDILNEKLDRILRTISTSPSSKPRSKQKIKAKYDSKFKGKKK